MTSGGFSQWSKCSFRRQLFLGMTLFTALIAVTLTYFFISYESNSHRKRLRLEGEILANILTRELQLPLYAGNSEEVASHTAELMDYRNVTAIRVRDSRGEIVAESARSAASWNEDHLTVTAAISPANQALSPEAQLLGESSQMQGPIGSVELALGTLTISNQMQHFIKVATIVGVSFWLAVSALGFLVLRQTTRTLTTLLAGIAKIAGGDLSSRIAVDDNSDAGQAAAAINQLAATLQQRDAENHQLQLEKVNSLRLELDEEKTRHMAKLIQTNRMTSLGLLVSSMAHEINNPNGAINLAGEYLLTAWRDADKLLAELARTEGDFTVGGLPYSRAREEVFDALDTIARSSVRIERVVQNLRSYSLGDRSELSHSVDLNRVAMNALAVVRAHSKQSDVNIAEQLDPQLPLVSGNPFQLEQVITNLLLNALQALPPKGSRRVFLTTAWQQHDNSVTVEVRDEGHGIPAEHLPHLCEPFFSTRIDVGGSGLGLYITNFIVSEHHGRLEFASRPGSGSTVTVHLPTGDTPLTPPAG